MVKPTARDVIDRVMGPLVLLCALAIAWTYWDGRTQAAEDARRDRAEAEYTRSLTECQAAFNAAVVANVQIRDRLRTGRDTATGVVFARIGAIVAAAQTDDQASLRAEFARFRVAFSAYEVALSRLEKYKADNPLPEFPRCEARAARAAAAAADPSAGP